MEGLRLDRVSWLWFVASSRTNTDDENRFVQCMHMERDHDSQSRAMYRRIVNTVLLGIAHTSVIPLSVRLKPRWAACPAPAPVKVVLVIAIDAGRQALLVGLGAFVTVPLPCDASGVLDQLGLADPRESSGAHGCRSCWTFMHARPFEEEVEVLALDTGRTVDRTKPTMCFPLGAGGHWGRRLTYPAEATQPASNGPLWACSVTRAVVKVPRVHALCTLLAVARAEPAVASSLDALGVLGDAKAGESTPAGTNHSRRAGVHADAFVEVPRIHALRTQRRVDSGRVASGPLAETAV